ncbi:hypothetical protein QN219_30090 [Sinorhizobium sp. 7-81]|uniref:hypothetical protein n=1 Tax=Sinorhizobium sp. 8-89 TaxID=3049089 RepID=UPI0024C4051C|nr:hypothetical protein [Sinorhizobium sp. 8-89]MDK1494220.1 hypothetical protein [Sinorhizobium sp. 8-89]
MDVMTKSAAADRIREILTAIKPLAAEYYRLTGEPLGVTGEVAEAVAADVLGLELAPARTAATMRSSLPPMGARSVSRSRDAPSVRTRSPGSGSGGLSRQPHATRSCWCCSTTPHWIFAKCGKPPTRPSRSDLQNRDRKPVSAAR